MARPFHFDRSWSFPVASERLWTVLTSTSEYRSWWSWLRDFEPVAVEPGARSRATIGAPLPYVLQVVVEVVSIDPGRAVRTVVSGDLAGPAALEVVPAPQGSTARLSWDLELRRPLLLLAASVARPVLEWGHEWVVATGVEQFRRRAITDGTTPLSPPPRPT